MYKVNDVVIYNTLLVERDQIIFMPFCESGDLARTSTYIGRIYVAHPVVLSCKSVRQFNVIYMYYYILVTHMNK